MGLAKQAMLEDIDRGYCSVGEQYVCASCFNDEAIEEFIEENAESDQCDFCGEVSDEGLIAAPIDKVIELIVESIEYEWGSPEDEGVAWESREGGWQGHVTDSYDLLVDELEIVNNQKVLDAISNALVDRQWCQKDYYALPPEKALMYGWEEFCKQVKYKTRYVFFRVKDSEDSYRGVEEIKPRYMLDALAGIVSESQILSEVRPGTEFYRVRVHDPGEHFGQSAELGPPPESCAIFSNRMSPAGISMFYGAVEESTAIEETFDSNRPGPSVATVGVFKTLKTFKVLDLSKLPKVPSLFDEGVRHLRPGISFLYDFVRDISKPIVKDGREHIEYVPTQVMTEFFQYIFEDQDGENLKGIFYPSSRNKGGVACALFFSQKDCCDSDYSGEKKWLRLDNQNVYRRSLP